MRMAPSAPWDQVPRKLGWTSTLKPHNSQEPELEISEAIMNFLRAEFVGVVHRTQKGEMKFSRAFRADHASLSSLNVSDIEGACLEVLGSGFINSLDMKEHDLRIILFPVDVERQVTNVLLVGYRRDIVMDHQMMNIYLAVASQIGILLERVRNTEELRLHRTELIDLIAQKTGELTRSNEDLQQFAYIASHDLQEPLRMVIASLGILEKKYGDNIDDQVKQYIDIAIEGASRMRNLIDDLLAYSRVESSGKEFADVDMNLVLSDTLTNLGKTMAENHAVIKADPLPTIVADGIQMYQLLQNLVSNAIKYHGDAPPLVKISISCSTSFDEWVFSVRDNGIGIDPKYQEKIFQMFQRLHSRDEYEGTGIGLAIVKRIVERHGGRIWVESEIGDGSTFFFTIPKRIGKCS
jgi:signal transduction histidine kinase